MGSVCSCATSVPPSPLTLGADAEVLHTVVPPAADEPSNKIDENNSRARIDPPLASDAGVATRDGVKEETHAESTSNFALVPSRPHETSEKKPDEMRISATPVQPNIRVLVVDLVVGEVGSNDAAPPPRVHVESNSLEWPTPQGAQRDPSADPPLVRLVAMSSSASRSAYEQFSTSLSLRGPHSTSVAPDADVIADNPTAASLHSSSAVSNEAANATTTAVSAETTNIRERDPPLFDSCRSSWTSSTCHFFALLPMPSACNDVVTLDLEQ